MENCDHLERELRDALQKAMDAEDAKARASKLRNLTIEEYRAEKARAAS